VAQRVASEVHLILEGSLRVLPRQIGIPGTQARGCVGVRRPWWPHLLVREDRAGGFGGLRFPTLSREEESFGSSRNKV
jgi:hypothetical protein